MTKKKKVILVSLLGLISITVGFCYTLWAAKSERDMITVWVKENRGSIKSEYPQWVIKSPSFIKSTIQIFMAKDIIGIDLYSQIGSSRHLLERKSKVLDLNMLKTLSELEFLFIADFQVKNLSALKSFPKLTKLFLIENNIQDISVLKNLQNLEMLKISNTLVKDISVLKSLPKLKYLFLVNVKVDEEQIKDFRINNPFVAVYTSQN